MEMKRSKYLLAALTVICILLIIVTSIKDGIMEPLRTGVGYVLVPLQTGVNAVGKGIYTELKDYSMLKDALAENERMKEEIARLTEENNRLLAGQFELDRLRELYQLDQTYMQYEKIGARIIAKDSGDWFQVFRVDKAFPVGIVADVGANYATVRSIIDDSSRVSAMTIQSGDKCIVAGDLTLFQEGRLRITNITKDGDVKDGDQIITSDISSQFLPGILIGYAADITVDPKRLTKSGYLIPVADFDNLQEVLIITETKYTGEDGEGAGS